MADNIELTADSLLETVEPEPMQNQIDLLYNVINLNRQQLEHLLVFSVQQQSILDQIVQVMQTQSRMINEINQWKTSAGAIIADTGLNINNIDEAVKEIQQNMQNLPNEFQQIQNAINNIRIYRQEY